MVFVPLRNIEDVLDDCGVFTDTDNLIVDGSNTA